MPVPANLSDLSTSAASNSPAGSETPADADNYLRAHASFLAQLNTGAVARAGNIPMGGYKHTGAANAAAAGQYLVYGQDVVTGAITATRATAGTVATFQGQNTSETFQHAFGTDAGDNPNVGYYAVNWGTGAAQLDIRVGGDTSTYTRMIFSNVGDVFTRLQSSVPGIGVNNYLVINATSDTNLRFSYRGSDGVTRTANLTMTP